MRVLFVVAAVSMLTSACRRGDREIREQYTAAFDAPPVVAVEPCPDADAKLGRLQPLFELAVRAQKVVKKFDAPLPPDLARDLMATPIAGLAEDYRCFLADGSDRGVLMGFVIYLFLRKGETLLAAGQTDAGYAHVIEALSVYEQPRAFSFIYYLGAGYKLRYVRKLLEKYPPPRDVLEELEGTAPEALLPRWAFCAGIKEEFLALTYPPFYDQLAPLHARAARRWGDRAANAFAEVARDAHPGDLALWRTARDLYMPLIDGCLDFGQASSPPLMRLEKAARAKLASVPKGTVVAFSAPFTLERLPQFGALQDDFLVFMVDVRRRRLHLSGLPTDAASVRSRVFVPSLRIPLTSDWDGSTATVEDDPAVPGGVVVIRGNFREALPPLGRR
ncbi:MAG TPA: hypothetical protein VN903_02110 [Polyangia bacterium]|nr:hypothetical protein [Polyangia bacterium]